jgi:hypothetical protein
VATIDEAWSDNEGRWHHPGCDGCDGRRYCDTDPEDDRGETFDHEPGCVPACVRPCGGCWTAPASSPAYLAAEHRAQVRAANAGRGLDEMVRLVELGTMLRSSLDAARDEYDAARRAVGCVHSTPIGCDPLPGPLHWDALEVVAQRLHGLARADLGRLTADRPWGRVDESGREYWRIEARALLVVAFGVAEQVEREMVEAGRRFVSEMEG